MYVFKTPECAEAWRTTAAFPTSPIRAVLAVTPFTWDEARAVTAKFWFSPHLFAIYPSAETCPRGARCAYLEAE
jgi:hypothetical protein